MEIQQLKPIKQKKLSNNYLLLLAIVITCVLLSGCIFRSGTYYEYLTEAPIITTDKGLAMQKHIIAEKKLNDTTFYYYTESTFSQTKDYEKAKKGFITVIKNIKNGKAIGKQVCLDGFGDTMIVDYYDRNCLDSLHISYFGNKKIRLYHEYKKGKKDGVAKYYYPNGNMQQITHWVDNIEQGEYVYYYQNGNVEIKGNYNRGVKDGIWLHFSEYGDTLNIERWNLGVLFD